MSDRSALLNRIKCFAEEHMLFDTPNLIVGVSGGPDSIALISILKSLSGQIGNFPNLYAVHVNHGLRDEADLDCALAVSYCESIDVPVKVFNFDVRTEALTLGRSLEETGRILRYKAFDSYAREILGDNYENISRIAVAHHRDDVAETMMMNLFRGSGLEGLVSPSAVNGRIIRPLLCVSKGELVDYLNSSGISYAVDATNFEEDCTRNIWRNSILPSISRASNKDAAEALLDTYELLEADLDFISYEADKKYEELLVTLGNVKFLPIDQLMSLHKAIRTRVIRLLWKNIFGNLTDFTKVHMKAVSDLIDSAKVSETTIDLSFGRKAVTANNLLTFCENSEVDVAMCRIAEKMGFVTQISELHMPLVKTSNLPNSTLIFKASIVENSSSLEYNSSLWYVPAECVSLDEIIVANGVLDLKFKRAGAQGSKLLGDILSDLKVPKSARRHVVVMASDNQILWIPGVGHSVGFTSNKSYEAWLKNRRQGDGVSKLIRIEITE